MIMSCDGYIIIQSSIADEWLIKLTIKSEFFFYNRYRKHCHPTTKYAIPLPLFFFFFVQRTQDHTIIAINHRGESAVAAAAAVAAVTAVSATVVGRSDFVMHEKWQITNWLTESSVIGRDTPINGNHNIIIVLPV